MGWSKVAGAIGDAQEHFFEMNPDPVFAMVAGSPQYAFNEYLQIGIAYGILGLILFLCWLAILWYLAKKQKSVGLEGLVVSFAVICFASYPFQFIEFFILCGLMTIYGVSFAKSGFRLIKGIAIVLVVAVVYGVFCFHEKYDRIENDWNRMSQAYKSRHLSNQNWAELDSMSRVMGESTEFLLDYGKILRANGSYEKSTEVLLKGLEYSGEPVYLNLIGRNYQDCGNCEMAEWYFKRSATRLPNRLYPHYLLAQLYADSACFRRTDFERKYDEVMSFKPKVESNATERMRLNLIELRKRIEDK